MMSHRTTDKHRLKQMVPSINGLSQNGMSASISSGPDQDISPKDPSADGPFASIGIDLLSSLPSAHIPSSSVARRSIDQHPNGHDLPHLESHAHDDMGDDDSTFGEADSRSHTSSTTPSIYDYRYENGRRYHAFRDGAYIMPNDEKEQQRLDTFHHIVRLIMGGKLYRSPMRKPQRVLDLGTGTGIWAIDFAEENPGAVVTGVDLSPIQPIWIPPNCEFLIDDFESDWEYNGNEKYDFIHARALCGSIKDWPRFVNRAYQYLNPGGWVEFQEHEAWMESDDDSMKKAKAVTEWQTAVDEASTKFGRKMNVAAEIGGYLASAGFVNTRDEEYKVPSGPWAKNAQKEIGMFMLANMLDLAEAVSMALLTRVLGRSYESVQDLVRRVQADFRNPDLHAHATYHIVCGQKPLAVRSSNNELF